jgi:hypothetical protein
LAVQQFFHGQSGLVKATDMNVHPTGNPTLVTHVAWTFMSEIRPADSDEANTFCRTAILPRVKRAGEGDGHECPSYAELPHFASIFTSLQDL